MLVLDVALTLAVADKIKVSILTISGRHFSMDLHSEILFFLVEVDFCHSLTSERNDMNGKIFFKKKTRKKAKNFKFDLLLLDVNK